MQHVTYVHCACQITNSDTATGGYFVWDNKQNPTIYSDLYWMFAPYGSGKKATWS